MLLNSYNYEIHYLSGKENCPADLLSRLPISDKNELSKLEMKGTPRRAQLLHLRLRQLPITKRRLKEESQKDDIFQSITKYLTTYWPEKKNIRQDLLAFFEKREEMSIEEGILLWKGRIYIPPKLRTDLLQMLHDGHPGICAMQSLARMHIYWPNIDADIVEFTKKSVLCHHDTNVPLYPWAAPPEPWSRIHIDFAGPYEGRMFLIVIDAYTRWLEVIPVKNITSKTTVTKLREIFARFGLPRSIVSDNGPQLTSDEFEQFCREHDIKHIKVTPYHPKSNGLAERAVRTFKNRMEASDKK